MSRGALCVKGINYCRMHGVSMEYLDHLHQYYFYYVIFSQTCFPFLPLCLPLSLSNKLDPSVFGSPDASQSFSPSTSYVRPCFAHFHSLSFPISYIWASLSHTFSLSFYFFYSQSLVLYPGLLYLCSISLFSKRPVFADPRHPPIVRHITSCHGGCP